jgi:hypothetical protein
MPRCGVCEPLRRGVKNYCEINLLRVKFFYDAIIFLEISNYIPPADKLADGS